MLYIVHTFVKILLSGAAGMQNAVIIYKVSKSNLYSEFMSYLSVEVQLQHGTISNLPPYLDQTRPGLDLQNLELEDPV